MLDFFEHRAKYFMKIPKELHKYQRETYAVQLRKAKRNFYHQNHREKLGGSIFLNSLNPENYLKTQFLHMQILFPETPAVESLLLSFSNNENLTHNIKTMIESLISFTKTEEILAIQCFIYFFQCISRTNKYFDLIYDYKIHIKLLEFLDLGIDDLYESILYTLNIFCEENPLIAKEIVENGFLDQLHSIVFSSNQKITNCAAFSLYVSIRDSFDTFSNREKHLALKLCKIFLNEDFYINLWIVVVLSLNFWTDFSNFYDIVPCVLNSLKSENFDIGLKIISNWVYEDQAPVIYLINAGLLDHLLHICEKFEKWKKFVFFVISNMVVSETLVISMFLCHDIKKLVWNSLTSSSLDSALECSFILLNIMQSATDLQKHEITTEFVFLQIHSMLGIQNSLDLNYLKFLFLALDNITLAEKTFDYYESSKCHDKVLKLFMSDCFEVRAEAATIIQKFEKQEYSLKALKI